MGSTESCDCLPLDLKEKKKQINVETETSIEKATASHADKNESKIHIGFATAYLLATIISDYFNNDANICEFIKREDKTEDIVPILDHIILYGGSVRDLMLNKTTLKDIDITINTRELTKLQLIHLQKYHNTLASQNDKIKCIFWRHFLNKFNNDDNKIDINKHNFNFRLMNTFNCNYVINAKWISEIIINSNKLFNKLNIQYFESSSNDEHIGCTKIKIKDDVMWNGINIKGQDIDFFDPGHQFEHMFDLENEKKLTVDDDDEKTESKLRHKTSIRMLTSNFTTKSSVKNVWTIKENEMDEMDEMDEIEENKKEIIKIELPIHSTSVISMLERGDFSFNLVIIPFDSIYQNLDINNFDDLNIWKNMVKNGSSECDSLKDIENRIIRTAFKDPLKTIKYNFRGQQRFFYRVLKFGARYYNEWTMDEELINAVIATYNDWFNIEIMNIKKKCDKFLDDFIYGYVEQIDSVKWNYNLRFKVMTVLMFHERMINMLNTLKLFSTTFNTKIKNIENINQQKQFIQICIEYKYPLQIHHDKV